MRKKGLPGEESTGENIHKDHRKRLKKHMRISGSEGMSDYMLLEFILSFAIPRKDTNPLAHTLIDHFGSFDKVFEASKEELTQVPGTGEHTAYFLISFLPVLRRYLERQAGEHFLYSDKEAVRKFLCSKYLAVKYERAMLLNFDSKGTFLGYDFIAEGDFGQVDLNCRKIASSVIKSHAAITVLAHNHPSGICRPSADDLICVKNLKNFLSQLEVTLADSIILTQDSIFFFSSDPSLFNYLY